MYYNNRKKEIKKKRQHSLVIICDFLFFAVSVISFTVSQLAHTENVDGHIQYAYGVASRLFLFVVVDVTIDASFVHYVHSSLGE